MKKEMELSPFENIQVSVFGFHRIQTYLADASMISSDLGVTVPIYFPKPSIQTLWPKYKKKHFKSAFRQLSSVAHACQWTQYFRCTQDLNRVRRSASAIGWTYMIAVHA